MLPDVVPADRSMWIPYATAEGGPVETFTDSQTNGVIRNGGRVVRDVIKNPYDGDRVTLVLEPRYQGFTAATAIAAAINDEVSVAGDTSVASLRDLLEPYTGGHCQVFVEFRSRGAETLMHLGERWRVRPEEPLLKQLRALHDEEPVQLVYQ